MAWNQRQECGAGTGRLWFDRYAAQPVFGSPASSGEGRKPVSHRARWLERALPQRARQHAVCRDGGDPSQVAYATDACYHLFVCSPPTGSRVKLANMRSTLRDRPRGVDRTCTARTTKWVRSQVKRRGPRTSRGRNRRAKIETAASMILILETMIRGRRGHARLYLSKDE